MSIVAKHHKDLADAAEVEINALALQIAAIKRRRDAHRQMEKFFSPPATPLPPIKPPPPGIDPDFDDVPPAAG